MPGGPQSRFSCFGCRHPVAPTHFSRDTARADAVVGPLFERAAWPRIDGAAAVYMEANKAFGGIDILINNAGAYEARPWIC